MKTFAGLRMKLNYFHKSLDGSKNWNTPDEDRMAIRPEWTTVDRVLDMRFDVDLLLCLMSFSRLVMFGPLLNYLENEEFFPNGSVNQFSNAILDIMNFLLKAGQKFLFPCH